MAQRIVVTGAAGQAGRAVVADLREHGYDVLATDTVVSGDDRIEGMLKADLTDYGQAVEVLSEPGVGAVVHLANIPAPRLSTPAVTFNANMAMNFNVFQAAAAVKLSRVVWASSETTLGLPFDTPPRYAPVDEEHYPVPTTTYALSKVASETIAGHISEWSGIPFVALRFSNIMAPEDYEWLAGFRDDPQARKWNLWGYIDQRDVAQACRKALEAPAAAVEGSPAFIIAAADTVLARPSAEVLAEVFPGVKLTRDVGEHGTLLAIDRARELLGFNPEYSWRDHLTP
jgi:nucleoside-diphosphate-sugar epimerase